MRYHIIAFFLGFLLDLILGDPQNFPHPVRLIGKLITGTERILRGSSVRRAGGTEEKRNLEEKQKLEEKQNPETKWNSEEKQELEKKQRTEFYQGIGLTVIVPISVMAAAAFLLFAAYSLHRYLGIAVETLMTYQILAVKSLKVESMKVYDCLKSKDLEKARVAVSMIVGRDTECLDEEGIAKAAIETVAENTSDGVIAPMLYLALGGPILGFGYKAVNTMDSMVGYRNEKYLYFGRAAAKLDDILNYFPARISAYLMIVASFLSGGCFSLQGAWKIYRRDRRKHASPNSAQTESVCAGALGIRLAGDARYFGKIVEKPFIGDALRRVEYEDIKRANRLLYVTAWMGEIGCLAVMMGVLGLGNL
ncbi:MAG: adenosylcobinamide-phosphate synthase CbiB [Blautia sp.]|nr:adenosylcobinamide-phosphate synthase CbiB [Lachnoclostridium sp.]MCM1210774.1 adenosylcobinamide-phosphate synthase CbiB [Blautia sp.]